MLKWMTLIIALITSGCSSIPTKVWTKPIDYHYYLLDQGVFVEYPTIVGDVVGSPLSILGIPMSDLLEGPNEGGEKAIASSWGAILLFPFMIGDVVGSPFLGIRRSLWDFPIWIFTPKDNDMPNKIAPDNPEPQGGQGT